MNDKAIEVCRKLVAYAGEPANWPCPPRRPEFRMMCNEAQQVVTETDPVFDDFVAGREYHVDLEAKLEQGMHDAWPTSGWVYETPSGSQLYIEDTLTWENPGQACGRWYLLLDRSDYRTDDLHDVECKLFAWAKSEDMV